MEQIADAPWIREAEQYGMPPYEDPPECPICGSSRCHTIYKDRYDNVFACDQCLQEQDVWEWQDEQREASRPDWADE
jgi:hypothetical protein